MNKTIKQAERYEDPKVKECFYKLNSSILAASGQMDDLTEKEISDWD